jgi:hypothetical protein
LDQAQSTVTQAAEQARQQAQEKVDKFLESLQGQLKPGSELDQAAKQAEDQVRQQLEQMQEKLSELFSFKAQTEAEKQAPNGTQSPVTEPAALTRAQLQQWLTDINTQWLITGHVAQTRAQLLAVEQALAISDLPDKTRLIRMLGEDMARLETVQGQSTDQWAPVFNDVTDWVQSAVETHTPTAAESDAASTPAETNNTASGSQAWTDQLLQGFTQLFEVRKRESSEDLTNVDKLVKADVIEQRGLLLIERMRWAVQTQSSPLLAESLTQMRAFADTYFPQKRDALEPLLQPLDTVQFQPRQPLSIVAEVK